MIEVCPNCGAAGSLTRRREKDVFPYGQPSDPFHAMLECEATVVSCGKCKDEFWDIDAEDARDAAVKAHLSECVRRS